MNITNPKIDGAYKNMFQLLEIDKGSPRMRMITGAITVPNWVGVKKHFQGIAPINGFDAISGQICASADTWWCASFQQTSDTEGVVTDVIKTSMYDHAGGIQRIGDLLPIGLERPEGASTVAFYDVRTPVSTHPLYEIGVEGKASAVAITNYTDQHDLEQAVLFIYQYDPQQFLVYKAPAATIGGKSGWVYKGVVAIPNPSNQFQCFSFATQTNADFRDVVYLLGFRQDEELYLYSMDLADNQNYGKLQLDRIYTGWSGSQWRYGVGLQIVNSKQIRIFGCSEDPTGTTSEYTFPIYYWGN